jgi:hypothetical protein
MEQLGKPAKRVTAKKMCSKYLAVANGWLQVDDDEEFVMFTFENPIERDVCQAILNSQKLVKWKV